MVPSRGERNVRIRLLKVNAPPARAWNLGMKLEALFKERRTGAGGQHRTDTGNGARLNTGGAHASLGCACRTI